MTFLRAIVIASALSFTAVPATMAASGTIQMAKGQQPAVADIVFNEVERRIIEDYFGHKPTAGGGHGKHKGKSKQRPPGFAKRGQLPPGLAKRSELPPGLAKRDIPHDLASRLGIPPHGTHRVIVDSNVVLVETATGIVLDILQDVITGGAK